MALIYCPECGTQVSEHAIDCIKCAFPISKLKNNNSNSSVKQSNYPQAQQQVHQPVYHTHHYHNTKNNDGASGGLIAAGYIVALLSLLFLPILLMVTGVVLGIVTIAKGSIGHGIAHILISLLFGIIGAALGILMYL
jgi:hypothetical protein